MQNQESRPTNPIPKRDIPESWAQNGRCPACEAASLKVTHLPDMADYMMCTKCEISFEVENGGRYVRLKYVPDSLEFVDAILHNRWVEASKLAGIIAKHRPVRQEKKVSREEEAQSLLTLPQDEAWNRALRMYRLGNNPKMIQLMLLQAGQSQEQADAIFARLKKVSEEDARRQGQKFWTIAGISLFAILLMTMGWLAASGRLPVLFGLATVTPAPTQAANQPSVISMLVKLVPSNAQPDILNLPDTTVETNKGPASAACPAMPDSAAELFGGDPAFWARDMNQFPSWQMVSPSESFTIKVPMGMTAGYMDNESFEMKSVSGPATIHNVNFLVITCD